MTDREAIEAFKAKCGFCEVQATCESMVAEGKSPCLNLNAISALQERIDREQGVRVLHRNLAAFRVHKS